MGCSKTTLVVVTREFGRTPRIGQFVQNKVSEKTGRDHWPHAFSVLLVRVGHVYRATDRVGVHLKEAPVSRADLAATILHHLGIDAPREYWDNFERTPPRQCDGLPVRGLG